LCRSFDALARARQLSAVHFLSMHADPSREKLLNPALVSALGHALSGPEGDAIRRAQGLLVAEHGITARPLDLLATACCCSSCADPEYGWAQRSGLFKALGLESTFTFVARDSMRIICRLTYRVPAANRCAEPLDGDAMLRVRVNGVAVAALEPTTRWRTATIAIDEAHVREGWNSIGLTWPMPHWTAAERIGLLASSLERGEAPDVFPAYGELHTFTAAACGPVMDGLD
jgi:hypothetical protein